MSIQKTTKKVRKSLYKLFINAINMTPYKYSIYNIPFYKEFIKSVNQYDKGITVIMEKNSKINLGILINDINTFLEFMNYMYVNKYTIKIL